LAEIDLKLADFEPLAQAQNIDTNQLRPAVNARKNVERFAPTRARRLRFTVYQTTDAEPCIDELEVYTVGGTNIALASGGTKATASSVYPNSDIHRLEHLNDAKHGNSRSWISNERGKGWVELEFAQTVMIDRIIWGRDREQKFSDRLPTDYRIEVATGSNQWWLVSSSLDRHAYNAGRKEEPAVNVAGLTPQRAEQVRQMVAERKRQETRIAELSKASFVYGGSFTETPGPTYRFHRGDPMQKREVISAGGLSLIPVKFDLSRVQGPATEASLSENQRRRLALAKWIINPANPVTARVLVNRLWHYHFGEGLVNTPSDLGVNGAKPTHPELLDWLAAEFMAGDWSIKRMHRLIVISATYRQASDPRQDGLAVDATSRLLWRFPPRRLEAEALRDSVLAISGNLDRRMGGAGFRFFEPNDNYVRVYTPRKEYGPDTFRRMIYGTIVRQRPDGVFGVFDCPDAGQIAPKRTRSTTPLQALNLWNSNFVLAQADYFAARLVAEAGDDVDRQIQHAFACAFQRDPDDEEIRAAAKLIRAHGLQSFCRALLNANEFVYLN
jgi:hypothetical protein